MTRDSRNGVQIRSGSNTWPEWSWSNGIGGIRTLYDPPGGEGVTCKFESLRSFLGRRENHCHSIDDEKRDFFRISTFVIVSSQQCHSGNLKVFELVSGHSSLPRDVPLNPARRAALRGFHRDTIVTVESAAFVRRTFCRQFLSEKNQLRRYRARRTQHHPAAPTVLFASQFVSGLTENLTPEHSVSDDTVGIIKTSIYAPVRGLW